MNVAPEMSLCGPWGGILPRLVGNTHARRRRHAPSQTAGEVRQGL
jgi:hypothetical protein